MTMDYYGTMIIYYFDYSLRKVYQCNIIDIYKNNDFQRLNYLKKRNRKE